MTCGASGEPSIGICVELDQKLVAVKRQRARRDQTGVGRGRHGFRRTAPRLADVRLCGSRRGRCLFALTTLRCFWTSICPPARKPTPASPASTSQRTPCRGTPRLPDPARPHRRVWIRGVGNVHQANQRRRKTADVRCQAIFAERLNDKHLQTDEPKCGTGNDDGKHDDRRPRTALVIRRRTFLQQSPWKPAARDKPARRAR